VLVAADEDAEPDDAAVDDADLLLLQAVADAARTAAVAVTPTTTIVANFIKVAIPSAV
jgi:hypothetical protein